VGALPEHRKRENSSTDRERSIVFLPRVILAWLVIAWGTAAPSARAVDIEALLAGMTLDEKIGQMTQAERAAPRPMTCATSSSARS
jgi:hypothetical protein